MPTPINPSNSAEEQRRRRQANPMKRRMHNYKARCKRQGWEYDLSPEYLESVAVTHCPILDIELTYDGKAQDSRAELDRIDNSKGYVMDNVQFISRRANRIKSDSTEEELQLILDYMRGIL